jgi:hypothetical protein
MKDHVHSSKVDMCTMHGIDEGDSRGGQQHHRSMSRFSASLSSLANRRDAVAVDATGISFPELIAATKTQSAVFLFTDVGRPA